ncbi:bifunctional DNA-formamidopyrimidine glycosylase/DNA-(apurinic or apyrimidinic site) lyase [Candidatus Woesebacteria bacterium]|nr:bifunctional DNA-formamidopyrimidine glycosylase/DNA-(apurinic or apyrimidinic site) lyase [Candidatus Woesebacteria bacterium]
MPELPEVETIVRRLGEVLPNKIFSGITVFKEKSFLGDYQSIIGLPILALSRRAKLIRIHLPDGLNLLAHLKMTGQFIYVDTNGSRLGGGHPTDDWVKELPSSHTRIFFKLQDVTGKNQSLFFNDQRIFGWVRLASDAEVDREYTKYGPDIHTDAASLEYFSQKLSKTGRKIKQVIMDNSVVSGVGNIYACDGLNLCKLHPERKANLLTASETSQLLGALKSVIGLGIDLGGATIDNYRTVDGFAGKYQDHVRVYGKDGAACQNCGGIIQKTKIGGRGTFFCPNCQV